MYLRMWKTFANASVFFAARQVFVARGTAVLFRLAAHQVFVAHSAAVFFLQVVEDVCPRQGHPAPDQGPGP